MNVKNVENLRAFMIFLYGKNPTWGELHRNIIQPLQEKGSITHDKFKLLYYPDWSHSGEDEGQEIDYVYFTTKGEPLEWRDYRYKSKT